MAASTSQDSSHAASYFIVRMRIDKLVDLYKRYCIWAYPKPKNYSKMTVYMQTESPGLVSFVLGDDWERRLDKYDRIFENTATITDADEVALAGRVLKAGGAALDLSSTNLEMYEDALHRKWSQFEEEREYIFGWPEAGRVWVLRIVRPTITGKTAEEMEIIEEMYDMVAMGTLPAETFREITQGPLDLSVLTDARSMADYCIALQKLGAVFYENPEDSKEVEKCRLLDNQLSGHWG